MARSLNTLGAQGFGPNEAALIQGAASLRAVAEGLGVTAGVDPAHVDAFFGALPPSIDGAVLAALKTAASRSLPFTIQWVPAAYFKATVYEGVDGEDGVVSALLECPWVRDLGQAAAS